MDSARELRAMAMVAFPCPPLPIEGKNNDNEFIVMNSHDLLAFLMNTAAIKDRSAENAARLERQKILHAQYTASSPRKNSQDIWHAMTHFTRFYMMSYCPIMLDQLRFLPFDALTPPLRAQVQAWLAARYILAGRDTVSSTDFEGLGDEALYRECFSFVIMNLQ